MFGLRSGLWAGILLSICAFSIQDANAQAPRSDAARQALRGEAQARVSETDSLLEFRTRRVRRGRVDTDEGVLRAAYRLRQRPGISGEAEAAARAYLEAEAGSFGLAPDLHDLVLIETRRAPHASHVTFQQVHGGIPVLNRTVKVSLDRDGRPTMVLSAYAPHVRRHRRLATQPSIAPERARELASSAFSSDVVVGEPELFVSSEDAPRLVWRVPAITSNPSADWEVLIEAQRGELLRVVELSVHRVSHAEGNVAAPVLAPPSLEVAFGGAAAVDGSGLIFDPDPLTTAGVPYGPPFVDNNDADVPEVNAQRKEAVLREITQGGDGLYRLEGPLVRVVGDAQIGGVAYSPPAEPDPHGFRYLRSNPYFEAVMAYYHVDASQRYASALGVSLRTARRVDVNPRGLSTDDSQYYPLRHAIAFGVGGVDDAEDAGVIWHESAHALLENESPGLLSTFEGRAYHEGWADYWAGSYVRDKIERGEVPERDWRRLFFWDGNSGSWCGRLIDHPGWYPDQTGVDSPPGCGTHGEIYQLGLLWATTVMEIHSQIGRAVTDRLILASHAYLNPPMLMTDAAEALIQANVDLFGGIHSDVLISVLGERGFVDVAEYGPIVLHQPLRNTEAVGALVPIDVIARGSTSPVDTVMIFYGTSPVPIERLILVPIGDDTYRAELPLPSAPDTVRYYVEVVDQARRRARLPAGDAGETFTLFVGPDTRAPVIVHNPVELASLAGWPVDLVATVTDDVGVDSTWAEYRIETPQGELVREGEFGLQGEGDLYHAAFPVPVGELTNGSLVGYRLLARDVAQAENVSTFPEEGFLEFPIVGRGVLRQYDFETSDPAIQATGVWARGVPTYGLRVARTGSNVWATSPDASYPAHAQRSSLDLPPVNLDGLEEAYLVFWHWYDFEHNGQAEPGVFKNISLWDGGNVKLSVDGGFNWTVAEPAGGYNGIISSNLENPLGGEAAFGGYSYGWRLEVVPLPAERDVQIRFDFGTDGSNTDESRFYAGWYVDDVVITTDPPEDVSAPVVQSVPAPLQVRSPGQAPPPVHVRVFDDVGIDRAEVVYEFSSASGNFDQGVLRLAMSDTSLSWYSGDLPSEWGQGAGDQVDFRIRLVDFAGNETLVPSAEAPPLQIQYLHQTRLDVLRDVRPSGNWMRVDTAWSTTEGPEVERSALVSSRFDLPTGTERLTIELRHHFVLDAAVGANVKITRDGGQTWTVLLPEGGYPGVLNVSPSHVMSGEAVFMGDIGGAVLHRFDVSDYAGEQVQLRLDLGAARIMRASERWLVYEAAVALAGLDPAFPIEPDLALYPAYPNPFAGNTTIEYSLSSDAHVQLAVYDVLGRRVAMLVDGSRQAGAHALVFDGSNLASGIYVLRLRAGNVQHVQRMVIAR